MNSTERFNMVKLLAKHRPMFRSDEYYRLLVDDLYALLAKDKPTLPYESFMKAAGLEVFGD